MSRVLRQDVRGKERGKEREEEALREEEKLERRFVRYKRFPNGETEGSWGEDWRRASCPRNSAFKAESKKRP